MSEDMSVSEPVSEDLGHVHVRTRVRVRSHDFARVRVRVRVRSSQKGRVRVRSSLVRICTWKISKLGSGRKTYFLFK